MPKQKNERPNQSKGDNTLRKIDNPFTPLKIINFISFINLFAFILVFIKPWIAICISGVLICGIFLSVLILKNQFKKESEKLEKPNKDKSKANNEQAVELILTIFHKVVTYPAYKEGFLSALYLSIPLIVTAFLAVSVSFFNENIRMFFNIILVYIFLRLYVYFTSHHYRKKDEYKWFPKLLKIALNIVRFVTLIFYFLYYESSFPISISSAFSNGIIATIVVDTVFKELSEILPLSNRSKVKDSTSTKKNR